MIFSKIKPVTTTLVIYCILLTLLSLSQSVCGAKTLRKQQQHPLNGEHIKAPEGRRHATVATDVRCRLWQYCTSYEDDREDSHQWECSFDDPDLDANFGRYSRKQIVGVGVVDKNLHEWLELNGAASGTTMLVLSQASLSTDKMIVNTTNVLAIDNYDSAGLRLSETGAVHHLASPTGTLNTLVVRVNANDNSPPPAIALSEDIFGDEYCLKSQYNRCSYGQLQIQEYVTGIISDVPTATNAPGVIDIYVDANANGNTSDNIRNLANTALQEALGTDDPGSIFDLVLFCMPPGTGNWVASAFVNRWDSYYNNDWCQSLSAQMHEVGHNIGLKHSGKYTGSASVQEYGDETGMMGFAQKGDDQKMCYNPAKSWQVGWYADKQIELDVNTDLSSEGASLILNGVVDYQDNSVDRYIVAKIGNFYIGYNRAVSFNAGVREAPDQVTIVEKLGGPETSTESKLASKLSVGGFYTFQATDTVKVTATYVSNSNDKDAVVEFKSYSECANAEIQVVVTTDLYPVETSWTIMNDAGQSIYSVEKGSLTTIETYTDAVTLCRDLTYYFIIEDSQGDGICCGYGTGSYRGTFEGEEIFSSSGEFKTQETKAFRIPTSPTSKPTIDCMDNPTKKFGIEVNGTIRKKDCAWVASKYKAKRKEYCAMKVEFQNGKSKRLSGICKETCGLVGKGACKHLKL